MRGIRLIGTFLLLVGVGCGVKGDPLPPEKPPEIGKGRPTYKRAAEGLRLQPSDESWSEMDDDDDSDEENED